MPPLYCYNILYHTRKPQREPLVVEAADQKYKQTNRFIYLGGVIDENANINPEIERRTRFAWACFKKYGRELYDRPTAPLQLKVRMLKAEVLETLLYGCMTWTLGQEHYAKLRTVHHQLLLRTIGSSQPSPTLRPCAVILQSAQADPLR